MAFKVEPIGDLFSVRSRYKEFFLTTHGSLIGAMELGGIDPDGLLPDDHTDLAKIKRSMLGHLDRSISILEVYVHYDGAKVALKRRSHPISDLLSQERSAALNGKNLSGSALFHFIEVKPRVSLNRLSLLGLVENGYKALFDPNARRVLLNYFTDTGCVYVDREEIERQRVRLREALNDLSQKWTGVMSARPLGLNETWARMRFLATLDPRYLTDGVQEIVPSDDLDLCLPSGDARPVQAGLHNALRINGTENRYFRVAAINRFGQKPKIGFWGTGAKPPIGLGGNYLIATRWSPMSEFQVERAFGKKKKDLDRQKIDYVSMMTGEESRKTVSKAIKEKLDELEDAEALDEIWGRCHTYVGAFDTDYERLINSCVELDRGVTMQGGSLVWEEVDAAGAFAALQPGGEHQSIRDITTNCTVFSATSLIYKSATGQPVVEDLGGEEPVYVLETSTNEVFYYSDFVAGRSFTLAVGPTGSGKTFFKNTLTSHRLKYGGITHSIDVDPGTEPLAQLFGDDAGVFRVGGAGETGFNPFVTYEGEQDELGFATHMTRLLRIFMEANDEESLRRLEPNEQLEIDKSIKKILKLPKQYWRLSALVASMPEDLRRKFSRWVFGKQAAEKGLYAPLFDAVEDGIGALDKKLCVFNVQAIRSDPVAMRAAFAEIFYRTTKVFENPAYRDVPKHLDMDEAKQGLSIPYIRDFVVSKTETWRKWFAGITMWTQSPAHYLSLGEQWDSVRTAASSFIFLADQRMNEQLYKEAFKLTDGQCDAIRSLTPRREAFIVQPETGVSKKVILDVEDVQTMVNTSHPKEATLRDKMITQYGPLEGMRRAAAIVNQQKQEKNSQILRAEGMD